MIDPVDLRELVIRPALRVIGLWSEAAENLLLGTAVVESTLAGRTELQQVRGPAMGIFQIEPATHSDQWDNFLKYQRDLRQKVMQLVPPIAVLGGGSVAHDLLITDLRYAAVIARIKYWRVRAPLPEPHDIHGLGRYWKTHYNTSLGAGTAQKFIDAYPT